MKRRSLVRIISFPLFYGHVKQKKKPTTLMLKCKLKVPSDLWAFLLIIIVRLLHNNNNNLSMNTSIFLS